jgi:hypothetical protein
MTTAKPTRTITESRKINSSSKIVAEIAQSELDKLSTSNATIAWYNPEDAENPEQLIKFDTLSVELQEAILSKLALCQAGKFVSLEEYKDRKGKKNS